ncbi:Cyclin-dependent protein kinase inhibitor SMR12 [Hirschfeldia incana]|nr:Cyclin-dependent protein kinase inhibitor SMR12 [Hirschfeldia incana]
MSKITRLMQEEVTLGEVSETREEEFSDNKLVLDICRKRKRSDEKEEEVVDKDKDGFKSPTRPENRIPEVRECPPAPRKGGKKYPVMHRGKTMSCRRRLRFPPEYTVSSFITDLQWTIVKRDRY